jgi:hypothetical protein
MGLFDWLTGKRSRVERLPDRIWLTERALWKGFAREIHASRSETDQLLLVAHFPSTLERLEQLLATENVESETLEDRVDPDRLRREFERSGLETVRVVPADGLEVPADSACVPADSPSVSVLVPQRHPLHAQDERIVEFIEKLALPVRIRFHASLDEPLMQRFAGDWVQNMLRSLGMTEDEALESRMVARRLEEAQRQVAAAQFGDERADSAEEWFERNLPQ